MWAAFRVRLSSVWRRPARRPASLRRGSRGLLLRPSLRSSCTSAVPPEVVPPEAGADDDRRYLVEHFSVPRETMGRLSDYATLLVEWQARMKLVGPATVPHLWARHLLDSAKHLDPAPGRSLERIALG